MNRGIVPGLLMLATSACATDKRPPDVVIRGDTTVVALAAPDAACTLVPRSRFAAVPGNADTFGRIVSLAATAGRVFVGDEAAKGGATVFEFTGDGALIRRIGRVGGGPGEFQALDGGMTTLPDGRLVLRDAGNGRFVLFRDGHADTTWALAPTFGFEVLHRDPAGGVLSLVALPPADTASPSAWRNVLVRVGPNGVVSDTLSIPTPAVDEAVAEMDGPAGSGRVPVPFAARPLWTISAGRFVVARSDAFSVMLHEANGVVRVTWPDVVAPAFAPRERDSVETRFLASGPYTRRISGPGIPSAKPFLRAMWSDPAGRTWALLHRPGVADEADGRTRWDEPLAFAIIARDGRSAIMADGPAVVFSPRLAPAIVGDTIWIATEDVDGSADILRLEIDCGATRSARADRR